jgi:integrase
MTEKKRGRGRPPTGEVVLKDGRPFGVRVTMPDKTRPVYPFGEEVSGERAKVLAALISKRVRSEAPVPADAPETLNEWSERWVAWREERSLSSASDNRSQIRDHVAPRLGTKSMRDISRADLEELVDDFDKKVRSGAIHWKTAANIWGVVTRMFHDAANAKRRDLRARDDNPAERVHGPDRGAKKTKVYLYPSELLRLVTCETVNLRWRRLFAIAVYSYMRAGELAALDWDNLDLDHCAVLVHQNEDRVRNPGELKEVKGRLARRLPLEPTLMPLLRQMHAEAGGKGRVLDLPSPGMLSTRLRQYLARAGVKRAELFKKGVTHKQMTFHDLRATGITWMAVRGDDPLRIKQRAGHKSFNTTEGYIREAENLHDGFGDVFPELPVALLAGQRRPGSHDGTSV